MSLLTWLVTKLGYAPLSSTSMQVWVDEYTLLVGDIYIREMAFLKAANLISKALSKCEFKTYLSGKEVEGREHYLWNIEPNKNQNSTEFLQQLVHRMLRNPSKGALVIEHNGQLLVADDFVKRPYALYEDVFEQVTVKDFNFSRTWNQSEVLYFRICDTDIQRVVNGLYESYSKLITYSMNAYQKSRGTKGVFKYDTIPTGGTEERKAFDALINEKIKAWLNGDNAALPLGRGQEWKELEHKTYSNESTRDIRALIDDVSDFTANAYGIHPALLRGDVQSIGEALDYTLTFCIDPMADLIAEEINRKRNGYSAMASGTYTKIDTKQIKHVDLLSVATSIDKLIGSGSFCINDIRGLCGEELIDEPWAWAHFMTKNYVSLDEALTALSGGGEK